VQAGIQALVLGFLVHPHRRDAIDDPEHAVGEREGPDARDGDGHQLLAQEGGIALLCLLNQTHLAIA